MLTSLLSGLAMAASIASALPQSSPPTEMSCQQLGSGTQIGGYTTECNTDRRGGDLSNEPASSFSACFPLCDAIAECVGFSYIGGSGSGVCFFKSSIEMASESDSVDTAFKRDTLPPSGSVTIPIVTSTTTTRTAASTTTTTSQPIFSILPMTTTTTAAANTERPQAFGEERTTNTERPQAFGEEPAANTERPQAFGEERTTLITTTRAAPTGMAAATDMPTLGLPPSGGIGPFFCTQNVGGVAVRVLCRH
ncbi:hypothetical protein CB0940_08031 [Cercospora beticola]|uniref:Apple domain-containing protein n=1 Tax=Cercospora beticola TaxID=122368 RepID=A0A2G5HQG9_CERBT|nr:hypothetical protein CB0940_08031 [Cercospora beticola]PIA94786.1 hypothetical protein CB0940_08031 [Cercospora beticola]WPB04587.1 hypothetical protein RHO25_009233 [Cercospora beticola]